LLYPTNPKATVFFDVQKLAEYSPLKDTLGWSLILMTTLAIGIPLAMRWRGFIGWFAERQRPLIGVAIGFIIALITSFFAGRVVASMWPGFAALDVSSTPAEVKGSDLIGILLGTSALIATAGITYLVLPTDRAELRLAAYTKMALLSQHRLELKEFEEWYEQSSLGIRRTPACRVIKGLLYPREGLGGWYSLTNSDLEKFFGKDWVEFSKFVDSHLDDGWVRIMLGGLGLTMIQGVICLMVRYLGIEDILFHPVEFATILMLIWMNAFVGYGIVSLAFVGKVGESNLCSQIDNHVAQLEPEFANFFSTRRDQTITVAETKAEELKKKKLN
jgi:hypothetical protein